MREETEQRLMVKESHIIKTKIDRELKRESEEYIRQALVGSASEFLQEIA